MAKLSATAIGFNVVFVSFSLLVIGGLAYYTTANKADNLLSSARRSTTATGQLVKKGTPAFSICGNISANYALLTDQGGCSTRLMVQSSLADPLVGKTVIATGTSQNGIFYATSLK